MGKLLDTIRQQAQAKPVLANRFSIQGQTDNEPLVKFEVPGVAKSSANRVQTFRETVDALKTGEFQGASLAKIPKTIQEGIATSGAYVGLGLKDLGLLKPLGIRPEPDRVPSALEIPTNEELEREKEFYNDPNLSFID